MTDKYLHLDAQFVKAEIAKLIEAYPDLAEDESLRADMVEGETDAVRIIERALAERQEAETMAGAIKARAIDLAARQSRFERKSEAMRKLIKSVMQAADLPKVQLTEATLSIQAPRISVEITDVNELPQGYVRIKREPDKTAIKTALMGGDEIPGATLAYGDETLSIRVK